MQIANETNDKFQLALDNAKKAAAALAEEQAEFVTATQARDTHASEATARTADRGRPSQN